MYHPGRNSSNFWEMLFWRSITSRLCKGASWNYFEPFYLFFDGNYKADANLMIWWWWWRMMVMMMVFSLACYKHAKGFGKCALLGLQVFVTRELFYHVADIWRLAPTPACRASKKNKRFKSSRNTWSDHVEKNKRYPLNIVSRKTMKMISWAIKQED